MNAIVHTLADFRREIEPLSLAELRRRYPGEATTHQRILADARAGRCEVHAEFRNLKSFLSHVGPKLDPARTLDRRNPHDVEYGPGKVRWATPVEQANNRRDTATIGLPDGRAMTFAEYARRFEVPIKTLHTRRQRGWTDAEIVAGQRGSTPTAPTEPTTSPMSVYGPGLTSGWFRHEVTTRRRDMWPEGVPADAKVRWGEGALERFVALAAPRLRIAPAEVTKAMFTAWALGEMGPQQTRRVKAIFPTWREGPGGADGDPEAEAPMPAGLVQHPDYLALLEMRAAMTNAKAMLGKHGCAWVRVLCRDPGFLDPVRRKLGWGIKGKPWQAREEG